MSVIAEFSAIAWVILGLLGVMSVFAASVVLVKLGQFARAGVGSRRVGRQVAQVLEQLRAGRAPDTGADPALRLQVLAVALAEDPQAQGAQAMTRAREGIETLTQHMRGLDAVVQAAPMLGLLGTVVGMIEAFGRLAATSGAADPALLAGGIWTALVTTAMGLSIAILFYLLALWLEGRIATEAQALERMIAAVAQARPPRPQTWPVAASAPVVAPSSPFSTPDPAGVAPPLAPSPPPAAPPPAAPARAPLAQPVPGGAGHLQRTDPGWQRQPGAPSDLRPDRDDEAGPPPEGFRPRR